MTIWLGLLLLSKVASNCAKGSILSTGATDFYDAEKVVMGITQSLGKYRQTSAESAYRRVLGLLSPSWFVGLWAINAVLCHVGIISHALYQLCISNICL